MHRQPPDVVWATRGDAYRRSIRLALFTRGARTRLGLADGFVESCHGAPGGGQLVTGLSVDLGGPAVHGAQAGVAVVQPFESLGHAQADLLAT